MKSENAVVLSDVALFPKKSETYTFVSPLDLKAKFGDGEAIWERPSEPLRERSADEIAHLRDHPFFMDVER